MKLELQSASHFLVHLIRLGRRGVSEPQLAKFRDCLIEVFRRRYQDHWFPEKPFKGSGYRCIRINGKMDPIIGQAGEACGLSAKFLHETFPSELTMWIDPKEVSYRFGENGSICVLYEYKEGVSEPWHHAAAPASRTNRGANSQIKHNRNVRNSGSSNRSSSELMLSGSDSGSSSSSSGCKDSLYTMDSLLYAQKSVSIEQLAAYVSS